mgnify:CR=1 FL=1
MAKPTSLDTRYARHDILTNIKDAQYFDEHRELLHESASEFVFNEDDAYWDDDLVAQEVGNGCHRHSPRMTC